MSTLDGRVVASEIIRPAAILPEDAARSILLELALNDVSSSGVWTSRPNMWGRWSKPWDGDTPGTATLVGTIEIAYGTPSRYEVTIYRVSITDFGDADGWTVRSLVDEALAFGGLTLDDCPRADLRPPPPPVKL